MFIFYLYSARPRSFLERYIPAHEFLLGGSDLDGARHPHHDDRGPAQEGRAGDPHRVRVVGTVRVVLCRFVLVYRARCGASYLPVLIRVRLELTPTQVFPIMNLNRKQPTFGHTN